MIRGKYFILGDVAEQAVNAEAGKEVGKWPKGGKTFKAIQIRNGAKIWCGKVTMFGQEGKKPGGVYGRRAKTRVFHAEPRQWEDGDLVEFVSRCGSLNPWEQD